MSGETQVTATPSTAHADAKTPLQQLKRACEQLRSLLLSLHEQRVRAKEQRKALDKAQLKSQRWQALVLLRAVKAGLRDTFLEADAWKTRVQEQKDVVEAHQLKLQNLLYEKDHLLREIRRCRGFSTKEMDKIEFENGKLPIAVDPEIHRQHLDQLTKELETRKRMIAQLKQLKERIEKIDAATQAKQAFLDGLRQEVGTIEDATKALQQYMGAPVTAQLNRQHEANQLSAPLYSLFCELEAYQIASDSSKQMGLSIVDAKSMKTASSALAKKRSFPSALQNGSNANATDADKDSKRLKGASRSPSVAPTSSSSAVATIHPAPDATRVPPSRSPSVLRNKSLLSLESSEVVSTGTAEKLLALRPYEKEGSSAVNDDAMDVDSTNATGNGDEEDSELRSEQERRDLWKPSEKALLLTLSLSIEGESPEGSATTASFSILFQYLPVARIVTAEVMKSQPAVHTTSPNLLMTLYPGDDGLEIPRLACNYEFMEASASQYGKEAAFPADAACRPFYWAQWICGLHPAKRLNGNDEVSTRRPEPSVRSVMNQLVKRLVTSIHLKKQLELLLKASASSTSATDVVFVHSAMKALFPGDIKTHLESWKEIPTPAQDIFQLFKDQAGRSAFHFSTHGCRYYRVVFKNERARMSAIVEIPPEYPVRAPRFIFQPKTATSSKMENGQLTTYENQLKGIEVEVNAFYNELVTKESEQFLLMHQLRKVQLCFDVLNSALADGSSASLCFGRERRGKDRRQAIVMDPVSKELRHR